MVGLACKMGTVWPGSPKSKNDLIPVLIKILSMSFKDVQDSCRESSRKAFKKEFGRRCITSFTSVGLTIISEIESNIDIFLSLCAYMHMHSIYHGK